MTIPLDKAIETHRDSRRHRDAFQEAISESHELGIKRGADWQLEKCDDEIGNILYCLTLAGKITEEERIQMYVLFKEAMRPQQ